MKIVRVIEGKTHEITLTDSELQMASEEYDTACRATDVMVEITKRFAVPFEELPWFGGSDEICRKMRFSNKEQVQDVADKIAYSVEHNLGKNDLYCDAIWHTVGATIDQELIGEESDDEHIEVKVKKEKIIVICKKKKVAEVTKKEIKILDFDFFAFSDNRKTVGNLLAEADAYFLNAA